MSVVKGACGSLVRSFIDLLQISDPYHASSFYKRHQQISPQLLLYVIVPPRNRIHTNRSAAPTGLFCSTGCTSVSRLSNPRGYRPQYYLEFICANVASVYLLQTLTTNLHRRYVKTVVLWFSEVVARRIGSCKTIDIVLGLGYDR
jgi:hypothetical protein